MGIHNRLMLEVMEKMGQSPRQLLEEINKGVDKEWLQHRALHDRTPSANCHYCVDNADVPEQEELQDA